jgi:hypothetical protein
MSGEAQFQTWEVLEEFGFKPDPSVVYSDIHPGLSFDFGNFKLSASAVMGRHFQDVVLFTGVLTTSRSLTEVQFEMPRRIESREKCAAWLAWSLDKHADDDVFQPRMTVDWLAMGRANLRLLPRYFDQEAYEARPHCSVDKELTRPLLKNLAKIAEQLPPEEKVWFSFDGEVLKIRVGKELLALAANGKPWSNRYGLNAVQLTKPTRRLPGERVWFESWEDYFTIARCRYLGVVIEPMNLP